MAVHLSRTVRTGAHGIANVHYGVLAERLHPFAPAVIEDIPAYAREKGFIGPALGIPVSWNDDAALSGAPGASLLTVEAKKAGREAVTARTFGGFLTDKKEIDAQFAILVQGTDRQNFHGERPIAGLDAFALAKLFTTNLAFSAQYHALLQAAADPKREEGVVESALELLVADPLKDNFKIYLERDVEAVRAAESRDRNYHPANWTRAEYVDNLYNPAVTGYAARVDMLYAHVDDKLGMHLTVERFAAQKNIAVPNLAASPAVPDYTPLPLDGIQVRFFEKFDRKGDPVAKVLASQGIKDIMMAAAHAMEGDTLPVQFKALGSALNSKMMGDMLAPFAESAHAGLRDIAAVALQPQLKR